ncbi:hypothetical protein [Nocardia fluminea]|uniref:hypothetical protein n=1 Tax=Nocardia fluminea TaxID=134984 RepID=UPI00117E5D9A|nr:hypothetical protein [Nocardia fluminea]
MTRRFRSTTPKYPSTQASSTALTISRCQTAVAFAPAQPRTKYQQASGDNAMSRSGKRAATVTKLTKPSATSKRAA